MKRWVFTIILFLILGAIVNVAVAWVGCRWIPVDPWLLAPSFRRAA